jgi:hypothetical protein
MQQTNQHELELEHKTNIQIQPIASDIESNHEPVNIESESKQITTLQNKRKQMTNININHIDSDSLSIICSFIESTDQNYIYQQLVNIGKQQLIKFHLGKQQH